MQRPIPPLVATLALACATIASEPAKTTLTVKRLSCAGCAAGLERELAKIAGVTACVVDAAKGTSVVTYDPDKIDVGGIGGALLERGFEVLLSPWEPVDASFTGCSNGWCGSRRPNARVSAQPGAAPGHDVYCPVSGVVLRIKESTLAADLNGKPV
jgi:copper chaperone CopZ